MKRSNKVRLTTIKTRLEAISSLVKYMKNDKGNLASHVYHCLEDISNEAKKIMDSIEHEGEFNIKAKTEDD